MKPITDTQRITQEAAECRSEVCGLLGWDEMDYFDFQLESGLAYLAHYLQATWAVDAVKGNRVFWNWWKGHWIARDKDFLIYSQGNLLDRAALREFYSYTHDGRELSRCIRPTSIVLNDSYAVMMQDLIDTTIQSNV